MAYLAGVTFYPDGMYTEKSCCLVAQRLTVADLIEVTPCSKAHSVLTRRAAGAMEDEIADAQGGSAMIVLLQPVVQKMFLSTKSTLPQSSAPDNIISQLRAHGIEQYLRLFVELQGQWLAHVGERALDVAGMWKP